MPEISVLMVTQNGAGFIGETIKSVLKQSFADFEFVIMDDGSADSTIETVKSFQDSRIRLEERKADYINNLNEGLSLVKGEFVARIDHDDIMHSERLRIQLKRMRQHPEITVISSNMKPFSADGKYFQPLQYGEYFVENPLLEMFRGDFVANPTSMTRRAFLLENKLQYEDYPTAEDYKLWVEIAKRGGKFFIEPQNLVFYRISDTQFSKTRQKENYEYTIQIKRDLLNYLIENVHKSEILRDLYRDMERLEKEESVMPEEFFPLFYNTMKKMEGKTGHNFNHQTTTA
jgi:glycosyltransferase involved in cell wall biosynthesis